MLALRAAQEILEREQEVDMLLQDHFLSPYRRRLEDLTTEQTKALVDRVLHDDDAGRQVVHSILNRIERAESEDTKKTLSGKPVIITYLLEVVESLKSSSEERPGGESITEWEVFDLIIKHLMLRDLKRSDYLSPQIRRRFLRALSIWLSRRGISIANEENFRALIQREFAIELSAFPQGSRSEEVDRYFVDLRSSSTLTRVSEGDQMGWRFSHSSLREFLVCEAILDALQKNRGLDDELPITEAMMFFASSLPRPELKSYLDSLTAIWIGNDRKIGLGRIVSLLWRPLSLTTLSEPDRYGALARKLCGNQIDFSEMRLDEIEFSSEEYPADLSNGTFFGSELIAADFSASDLRRANFGGTILDGLVFRDADLRESDFQSAFLFDCEFTAADVRGTNFSKIDPDTISILVDDNDTGVYRKRLSGDAALGYLRFHGALTPDVPAYSIYMHHPDFDIVEKISRKLSEQKARQRRGLVQRGEARGNVLLARKFIEFIEKNGLTAPSRSDLVTLNDKGRDMVGSFVNRKVIPALLVEFFARNM
jgi:hypothetical protein